MRGKRIVAAFLCAAIAAALLLPAGNVQAASSGKCGESLTWSLDDDGTLNIEGTGAMGNYSFSSYEHSPFWCNESIISVKIGSGVTSISRAAFAHCHNLECISIPISVGSIGENAFYSCGKLKDIYYEGRKEDWSTVEGTGISTITTKYTVHFGTVLKASGKCGENVTWRLYSDGELELEGTGATWDYSTAQGSRSPFYYSADIGSVTVGNGITTIGNAMFYGCAKLTNITLPEGITSIGYYSFGICGGLRELNIPASVRSIHMQTTCNCASLERITVEDGSKFYSSEDGILYNKKRTELIRCPAMYQGKLDVPEGVAAIGGHAFCGCMGLTDITLPGGVEKIGDYAFNGCTALKGLTLPVGTETIGSNAFIKCSALAEIAVPASVRSIGENVFYGCSTLSLIRYGGTEAQWESVGGKAGVEAGSMQFETQMNGVYGSFADGALSGYSVTCAPAGACLAAASYDADGRLLDIRVIPLAAGSSSGAVSDLKKGACCKLFLLDGTCAPLCPAWTRRTD